MSHTNIATTTTTVITKKKTSTVSAPINVILGNITPQDPAKVNEINDTSTTLQSTLDDFAESPVFPFKKDPIKNSANLQNSTNQLSILPGTSSFVVLTTISNSTTGTSSTIKPTSAFDFNLNLSYEQNTPRIMENILVEANKIPYHLGDIFYQPPAAKQQKKKIPRIVIEGRVIVGKNHVNKLEQRIKDDERKEKDKAQRKEDR